MGRRRYHKKRKKFKHYKVNHQIRAPKVRLIDPKEGQIGVVDLKKALEKAKSKDLDLVEVSPKTNPPVVKILDYGKFKYKLEKKQQAQKTKKTSIKGIRLSLNMAENDLLTKEKRARNFLENKCQVKLEMFLKGREMAHVPRAFDQIKEFINNLKEITEVIQRPKKKGRRITAVIQNKS